jgi:outer membrane protein OmpA-like peptidoglycan-associated protein
MRRSIGVFFAAAIAVSITGTVQAQNPQSQNDQGSGHSYSPFLDNSGFDPVGPYIGFAGGGSFLNDISPNGGGADVKSQYSNGYAGLGTIGWNFGDGLRGEIEGGYRRNDVDGVRDAGPGARTGALGITTVMVNGLYDFDLTRYGVPTDGLVPHLGIGAGWADPRFDHAGPYNGELLSGHDNLFAYQGIAGVDYRIAPQIKLSLDYHYLGTTSGTFHLSPGTLGSSASTSIQDQAVLLGVRYELGASPPPPQPVAPPPTPVVRAPPPPPAPAPEAQRAFQVFFDFNKSDITAAARQVIKAAATTAQSGHFVHLVVTGHTDTVGSAQYNQGLSERRAEAVKAELVTDGLPDSEITTLGVGKTGLLVPTADGVREAQNRRATIELGNTAGS